MLILVISAWAGCLRLVYDGILVEIASFGSSYYLEWAFRPSGLLVWF